MDGKSRNLIEDYIEQIKILFPEVVTEVADKEGNNPTHKVDMEKLSILLGEAAIPTDDTEYRQKYGEKFTFDWSGKRRAIAEAQKRSTGTLRPCPEESLDWDTTENLYIEGDNLEVLKLLQDSYLGAVKMIYIDPPYNTGKDFVYKDNYKDNLSNYLDQTNTTNAVNSEASGRYHTNWLNMMYPRLKLARNLLTDDGVIFISIDENEISNLKNITGEIFGEDNLIGVISNTNNPKGRSDDKYVATAHEYIVAYAKSISQLEWHGFKPTAEIIKRYNKMDANGDKYREIDLRKTGENDLREDRPNLFYYFYFNKSTSDLILSYEDKIIDGYIQIKPQRDDEKEGNWRWAMNTAMENISNLLPKFMPNRKVWGIMEKDYLKSRNLVKPTSSWAFKDINSERGSEELISLDFDKRVFAKPKPLGTVDRVLKLGSNSDSIVLDFFSGSATTAHAVMQINAEDGGDRRYICVQLPEPTPEDSEAFKFLEKLGKPTTIPEIAKERIRRAGKKILEEQKSKNEGLFAEETPKLDVGFKVFKLDRSNVKNWDVEVEGLSEKEVQEALSLEFEKAMEILKDGRTELDLLYEVMLKLGLKLTTNVEEVEIDGKSAYLVGDGVMVASFAENITYSHVSKILDLKPDFIQSGEFKVVFADESFASDNDKTNAMQLLKQRGITNFEII